MLVFIRVFLPWSDPESPNCPVTHGLQDAVAITKHNACQVSAAPAALRLAASVRGAVLNCVPHVLHSGTLCAQKHCFSRKSLVHEVNTSDNLCTHARISLDSDAFQKIQQAGRQKIDHLYRYDGRPGWVRHLTKYGQAD